LTRWLVEIVLILLLPLLPLLLPMPLLLRPRRRRRLEAPRGESARSRRGQGHVHKYVCNVVMRALSMSCILQHAHSGSPCDTGIEPGVLGIAYILKAHGANAIAFTPPWLACRSLTEWNTASATSRYRTNWRCKEACWQKWLALHSRFYHPANHTHAFRDWLEAPRHLRRHPRSKASRSAQQSGNHGHKA